MEAEAEAEAVDGRLKAEEAKEKLTDVASLFKTEVEENSPLKNC